MTEFTTTFGPLIIIATVVLPAFIAAWVAKLKRDGEQVIVTAPEAGVVRAVTFTDHLYRALVLPLVEFVGRMGWSLVLILALVLTYRICDSIWGVFAYPFYLGELGYTGDEVAFASKFFGVGAIIGGLALGGWIITKFGRMFTLTLGAALAAATNLLYADLAAGGATMQAASDAIGFSALIGWMAPFGSEGLARLTFTIFWENIAIGIAGAAYIAWLSSIVAKKYAAVQYRAAGLAHPADRYAGARRAGGDDRGSRLLLRVRVHLADRDRRGGALRAGMVPGDARGGQFGRGCARSGGGGGGVI